MNRVLPAALLALAAVPAHAADESAGWEVGAAGSFADYSWDNDIVDDSSTGLKLFGGYRFGKWFGVEGAYHNFGDFEADLVPLDPAGENDFEVDGFSLVGKLYIPVPSDTVTAFAKAGWFDFDQQRVADDVVLASNSPSGLTAGAGVDVDVGRSLRFRFEGDWFDVDDANLWALNLGLVYVFGRPAPAAAAVAAPVAAAAAAPPPPPPPPPPVDSDGDGVLDPADRCPGTPAGASVDAQGCETELTLRGVNFEYNSAQLTPQDEAILDSVADILAQRPQFAVEVQGHTDGSGPDAYNQDLSERRASAVRDYLVGRGVPAGRLTARGYGESEPVAGNDTAEGRALNRRVTLSFSTAAE
jgi:outer membrane protein OmpA-like peptidoglycan-associated protein/opacity protein-like surface antigen